MAVHGNDIKYNVEMSLQASTLVLTLVNVYVDLVIFTRIAGTS